MEVYDSAWIKVGIGLTKEITRIPTLPNGIIIHEITVACNDEENAGFLAYIDDYPRSTYIHRFPMASGMSGRDENIVIKPLNPQFLAVRASTKIEGLWKVHIAYEEIEVKKKLS